MKKITLLLLLLVVAALVVAVVVFASPGDGGAEYRSVRVERGTVVREAVAVGRIEPRFEVPVKSGNGGVLTRRFVQLGQKVSKHEPLVEVRPVLTESAMLSAERALLGAAEAEENVQELHEGETWMGRAMLFFQGQNAVERMRRGVERARSDAAQQIELLREGQTEIDGKVIDFVIRAPIEGHVIDLRTELGEPVVPSSSYGSGSVLLVLADLDHPVFRGTVSEIDVGKLREGMKATLDVGALPGARVEAKLVEISLRSRSVNNATVFDVKLAVTPPPELVLRSGYSAVAHVEVERAADVLVLPERVVDYSGDRTTVRVRVRGAGDEQDEVEITTGLSDGLQVEIRSGLNEGDEVLERIY